MQVFVVRLSRLFIIFLLTYQILIINEKIEKLMDNKIDEGPLQAFKKEKIWQANKPSHEEEKYDQLNC